MKISSRRMGGLLFACASLFATVHAQEGAKPPRPFASGAASIGPIGPMMFATQNLAQDRALSTNLSAKYPRPESEWRNSEKAFYSKLLSQGKFDTLVLPFQVQGWSFDRATRSLMTAALSLAVAQSGKITTPDPYLVAKALGDGQRLLKLEDVHSLADAMGVKRIIWGYVGHDRQGKMQIRLAQQDKDRYEGNFADGRTPVEEKAFEEIAFTDEISPVEAYISVLPKLLKASGLDLAQPLFNTSISRLDVSELPDSPKDLNKPSDNPARDAYAFLLYSALVPGKMERVKERFAEKAFLAQLRLSPSAPEYKALRARTYMALGYRLAAIKALGMPQTDEEREVLAALNGDFPTLRSMASREKNPLKRLIEKLDENEMGFAYQVVTESESSANIKALKLPGTIWPFIAGRAFGDHDLWSQFDNAQLKMLLDYELPVKGYSLDEIAKGALSIGSPDKLQAMVDLSVFHHGRKFLEQSASHWCCKTTFNRAGVLDYLELLQSFGYDNSIRAIRFQDSIQGRPEAAIAIANAIDAVYKGFPYYVAARARAEYGLAERAGGVERDSLLKSAYQNAFNAMYWEQAQSWVSDASFSIVQATQRQDYGYYGNLYSPDIPYRPDYWTWSDGGNMQAQVANKIAALKNARIQFNTLKELVNYYNQFFPNETRASDLLKSIDGRFIGSPEKNRLLAEDAKRHGDLKLAETLYRDNLKRFPELWKCYNDLGVLLFEKGEAEVSAKVYLAYPGFKPGADESRVVIANHAYDAAQLFYWPGYPELAKPFYVIAASQETGAASELNSVERLKLMEGDIQGAMAYALKSAQRYRNNFRFQDYIGILHASGQSREAWAAFGTLAEAGQGSEILEAALVGHHINASSEADVIAWVKQSSLKGTGIHGNAAATYLLQFVTTDRTPSAAAVEAIQSMDLVRYTVDGRPGQVLYRDAGVPLKPNEHAVKSALTLFAQGYRSLKVQDVASAKAAFDEAASHDDLIRFTSVSPCQFFLPYYAMAAVKTHQTKEIETLLASATPKEQKFYFHLAKAVLYGGAGDSEKALQSLESARTFSGGAGNWPLIIQQSFGEVAEWVGTMTGSPKIKALTLDWAKKFQTIQPWQSWSYALEAQYTQNPMDRKRALAMAHYLDPQSERLARFKQSEIDEAVKVFGKSNPFLKKPLRGTNTGDV